MNSVAVASPAPAPDLAACDREPIHIPGSIQPHGFLLAADEAKWIVRHASENVPALLGRELINVLGHSIDDVLGRTTSQRVRTAAAEALFSRRAVFIDTVLLNGATFALVAHRHAGSVLLEGERLPEDTAAVRDTHYQLENFLTQ